MKYSVHIIKALIILVCISSSFYCSGQCESIQLRTQQDVDNFIKTYGPCTTVNSLGINNNPGEIITNLDSLYMIENVTDGLQITTDSSLLSVEGMKNLKYVNYAAINLDNLTGQFPKLEEVHSLHLMSSNITELTDAMQFFPVLMHIKSLLRLPNRLIEEHTPMFTTGSNFRLDLIGVSDSTSLKSLSCRIKLDSLRILKVIEVYGFNMSYLPVLDSLKWLHLDYCLNSNFTAISSLKYIGELRLVGSMTGTDFGDGLKHIKSIKTLDLYFFKKPDFLTSILPSLEVIDSSLSISTLTFYDLSFFEEIEPPYQDGLIRIQDNINLKDCNSTFLCKALKRYPENVAILRNSGTCNKKEITKYCSTVSTADIPSSKLRIYPNAVTGYVNLEGMHQDLSVRMYDISGRPVDILNDST